MDIDKSNLSKCYICIEYPGIVENVNKMLTTLGGISEISKMCSMKNRRLELRFRPDDPFCKPACGDKQPTNAVLLKIKVKKSRKGHEESRVVTECEIMGRVTHIFRFKSVCDFQYLPMKLNESDKLENVIESILPSQIDGDHLKTWLESPASYFLPPAAFSRVDTQSLNSYMFRRDVRKKEDVTPGPLIGRTRKRRSGDAIFVSFNIPRIPVKPREKAVKILDIKFLNGHHLEKVKECFAERPIWSKLALMCVTSFHHDQLKYLLPAVAYYFVTGPFRVMWCRFGYDPRKDPNSRIYQTLDYRIRAPGLISVVKAKRSNSNYLLPSKTNHSTAKSVVITKDLIHDDQNLNSGEDGVSKGTHMFLPNMLPPARQMFYQYCDVKVPEIEGMLGRLPKAATTKTCDPKHGWLPSGFDIQCRDIINTYVMNQLKKEAPSVGSGQFKDDEDVADDSTDNDENWEEEFDDEDIDRDSDGGT